MIKPIITSKRRLSHKCIEAYEYGKVEKIAKDLLDTAKHCETLPAGCLGLAANQIGELTRIIVVKTMLDPNDPWTVMVNPVISFKYGGFKSTKETCLSHPGSSTKVRRHKKVKLSFCDPITKFNKMIVFKNFVARVVQHEMDHLEGKLI